MRGATLTRTWGFLRRRVLLSVAFTGHPNIKSELQGHDEWYGVPRRPEHQVGMVGAPERSRKFFYDVKRAWKG